VRAFQLGDGEIDTDELEGFLDRTAGPRQWLMTSVWLFACPPVVIRPRFMSVPVICPEASATRLKLAECEDRPARVFGEHLVGEVELRGWRWVAGQVHPQFSGRFPWELHAQDARHE
jgi:hypothetical protein